jgi:hypothetical protein
MEGLWSPLLPRGQLVLLSGDRGELRAFHHELAHFALQRRPGPVLWCDGEHGFNPYAFAELNLRAGLEADAGAERLLVKRCMTPFQWDTVLTQHLEQKLIEAGAALALAAPYDALFSTDELQDWEQEDYVSFSLRHLREVARRRHVPLLLSVDMARWWRAHPVLARLAYEAIEARWTVRRSGEGWVVRSGNLGPELGRPAERQRTLDAYLGEPLPVAAARATDRRHR